MASQPAEFPQQVHVGDFSLTARLLEKEDISKLYALIHALGWPTTAEDIQCIFEQNPSQMFGLFYNNGRLISSAVGIKWSDEEAYVPFFITVEEYQGRGLGSAIFKLMMHSLGDRNVMLFANGDTLKMYKKFGFGVMDDALILECEGRLKLQPTRKSLEAAGSPALKIEPVSQVTVMSVCNYEKNVSNMNRPVMFSKIVAVCGNYFFRAVSKDSATVAGYVRAQTSGRALTISALHADNITTARALLEALFNVVPNTCETVTVYAFEGTYTDFAPVLQQHTEGELKVIVDLHLLATKHLPPVNWQKVFVFNELPWSTAH